MLFCMRIVAMLLGAWVVLDVLFLVGLVAARRLLRAAARPAPTAIPRPRADRWAPVGQAPGGTSRAA